jgi:hypothetical protein
MVKTLTYWDAFPCNDNELHVRWMQFLAEPDRAQLAPNAAHADTHVPEILVHKSLTMTVVKPRLRQRFCLLMTNRSGGGGIGCILCRPSPTPLLNLSEHLSPPKVESWHFTPQLPLNRVYKAGALH